VLNRHVPQLLARSASLGGLLLVGLVLTGCHVTATPVDADAALMVDYPIVVVEQPPVRIQRRPSVVYQGRQTYLADGRWYYRTKRGWVYFRQEPDDLRRHRLEHHRSAYHDARDYRRRERPSHRRYRQYD
jgi:hypothetical protein